MNQSHIKDIPALYSNIQSKAKEIGFNMPSDLYIGSLLKTLISSRINANILEIGTGAGLSLAWMVDALSKNSQLTTIDNDPQLSNIAKDFSKKIQSLAFYVKTGKNG